MVAIRIILCICMHRIENLMFCLRDVKHKAQPAALLLFLIADFRQSNSITALWDLWPGIWAGKCLME